MNVRNALGSICVAFLAALFAAACSSESSGSPDAGVSTPTDVADASDGDVPTDDPDAACVCRTNDGSRGDISSLGCFCALTRCATFQEAFEQCQRMQDPNFNKIEEHAACNLVVIKFGGGFGGATFVFDAASHELVGAGQSSDYAAFDCGSEQVLRVYGGTFPPSDCPVSATTPGCGAVLDASKPDAAMDARGDVPPNVAPFAK